MRRVMPLTQGMPEAPSIVSDTTKAPVSTTNNPAEFTNYHGGAKKYDTYWEQEGKTFGVEKHTVYTTDSYDKLDQATKQKLEDRYQAARAWLGRGNVAADTYAGKLVRRDMMQAAKADGIFAVSEIVAPGTKGRKGYENKTNHPIIEGGTGYAVASGILLGKPVYVFNQDSSYGYETGWYKWDSSANNFVKTDVPVLTKNYAGIGSSTNETEIGRQAIRDVYANTFKATTQSSVSRGFQGYKGGFENIGKGTPQGDGKDKAMRAVAGGFILELDPKRENDSSTGTTSKEYPNYREGVMVSSKNFYNDVVMLARNNEFKNKPLSEDTKRSILDAHDEGVSFVVGDMPGVDSQFIDYLQEIGAKFTIYHTGSTPRIQITQPTVQPVGAVKEGVSELFESNPELAAIGTPKQYSQYLDTIFPDSKVKDIVYHGTDGEFDKFDKKELFKNKFTNIEATEINGFWFSESKEMIDKMLSPKKILSVLINTKNPLKKPQIDYLQERFHEKTFTEKQATDFGYDSFILPADKPLFSKPDIYNELDWDNYIVFEPEQVYILGGTEDIEGFKNFVSTQPTKAPVTSVKPTVKDLTRWSDLSKATDPYTDDGIVTTRISNTEEHFGNPFIGSQRRDKNGNLVKSKVDNITVFNTIDEADQAYRDWLMGTKHQNIKPLRREWILKQINEGKLDGKTLLYYKPMEVYNNDGTVVKGGYHSHADTLAEIVEELRGKATTQPTIAPVATLGPETKINIYASTGENAELSNFAVRPFTFQGVSFNSVEQAYQSLKGGKFDKATYDNKAYIPFNRNGIMTVSKFRGPLGTTTDAQQTQLMGQLIKASFEQNPDALAKLLATGNATLTHTQDKSKWGTEFPRLLMEVRDELRTTQPTEGSISIQPTVQEEDMKVFQSALNDNMIL